MTAALVAALTSEETRSKTTKERKVPGDPIPGGSLTWDDDVTL